MFDPAASHAKILSKLYMAVFLSPLIPYSGLLMFIALCLYYWTEKHKLLRRYARPLHVGLETAKLSNYLIGGTIYKYGLSCLILDLKLLKRPRLSSIVFLVVGILLYLSIVQRFISKYVNKIGDFIGKCLSKQNKTGALASTRPEADIGRIATYNSCRHLFAYEYECVNPISSQQAVKERQSWLRKRLGREQLKSINEQMFSSCMEQRVQYRAYFGDPSGSPAPELEMSTMSVVSNRNIPKEPSAHVPIPIGSDAGSQRSIHRFLMPEQSSSPTKIDRLGSQAGLLDPLANFMLTLRLNHEFPAEFRVPDVSVISIPKVGSPAAVKKPKHSRLSKSPIKPKSASRERNSQSGAEMKVPQSSSRDGDLGSTNRDLQGSIHGKTPPQVFVFPSQGKISRPSSARFIQKPATHSQVSPTKLKRAEFVPLIHAKHYSSQQVVMTRKSPLLTNLAASSIASPKGGQVEPLELQLEYWNAQQSLSRVNSSETNTTTALEVTKSRLKLPPSLSRFAPNSKKPQ